MVILFVPFIILSSIDDIDFKELCADMWTNSVCSQDEGFETLRSGKATGKIVFKMTPDADVSGVEELSHPSKDNQTL